MDTGIFYLNSVLAILNHSETLGENEQRHKVDRAAFLPMVSLLWDPVNWDLDLPINTRDHLRDTPVSLSHAEITEAQAL